jgi:hypothetical protein
MSRDIVGLPDFHGFPHISLLSYGTTLAPMQAKDTRWQGQNNAREHHTLRRGTVVQESSYAQLV